MIKRGLLLVSLIILLSTATSAQTVDEKINSIITFAEQYELGQISYLQMRVHSAVIREEVRATAGVQEQIEVNGHMQPMGLTEDKVREIFGKPTEFTDWAWLVNEEQEMKLDEPMARWEKVVFDGKKIQITFNAWPQVVKKPDGTLQSYYWVDFDIKFKQKLDFDINAMSAEIKTLGESYLQSRQGEYELAKKIADSRSILQAYSNQNRGECLHVLEQFFAPQDKQAEDMITRWTADLAQTKRAELLLEVSLCENCEWPWINFWYRLESRGDDDLRMSPPVPPGESEMKQYEDKNIDELEALLESKFREMQDAAKGLEDRNLEQFSNKFAELTTINSALERAYYDGDKDRQIPFEKRKNQLRTLVSPLPGFKEESNREVRFVEKIFQNLVEVKPQYCKELTQIKCPHKCENGQCIGSPAPGGNESIIAPVQPIPEVPEASNASLENISLGEINLGNISQEPAIQEPPGEIQAPQPEETAEFGLQLRITGETCTLASDCSGQDDICSNEACKELPKEVVEAPEEQIFLNIPEESLQQEIPQEIIESIQEGPTEMQPQTSQEPQPTQETPQEAPPIPEPQPAEGAFSFIDFLTGLITGEDAIPNTSQTQEETQTPVEILQTETSQTPTEQNQTEVQPTEGIPEEKPSCPGGVWPDSQGNCPPSDSGEYPGEPLVPCPGGCNINQYCNEERRQCECTQGFYECDGDWGNGCESTTRCKRCETNADCAKPRCADWDQKTLIIFGCYQEEQGWTEEKGTISLSGNCNFHPTGKVDTYIGFEAWGEDFENINAISRYLDTNNKGWCKTELEHLAKERKELERSMNKEFLRWFFEDYVNKDTQNWEKHISGIFDMYWKFVDNSRRTAEQLRCLGMSEFPAAYQMISEPVEYDTPLGKVKFWEEKKHADEFGMELLSPYMQIWIFPPKEFIKEEMRKAAKEGRMPGPEGEQPGPTQAEQAEIRNDPGAMEFITELSEKYGGSADAVITFMDGDERLFNMLIKINPKNLITVKPTDQVPSDVDVMATIDFDFLYGIISTVEKRMQTERPPWDKDFKMRDGIKEAMTGATIIAKIIGGITTGDIKVEPLSALVDVLRVMRMAVLGGPKGEGPGQEDLR